MFKFVTASSYRNDKNIIYELPWYLVITSNRVARNTA